MLLLAVAPQLLASNLSDMWKAVLGLSSTALGACLIAVGGYRIYKWARG